MTKLPLILSLIFCIYTTNGLAIFGLFKSNTSSKIENSLTKISNNLQAISQQIKAFELSTRVTIRIEKINPATLSKSDKDEYEKSRKQLPEILLTLSKNTQTIENNAIELSQSTQLIKNSKDCPAPKTLEKAFSALETAKSSKLSDDMLKAMALSKTDAIQKLSVLYPRLQLSRQGLETTLSVIKQKCGK